jgi:hypothetical protein
MLASVAALLFSEAVAEGARVATDARINAYTRLTNR